MFDEKSKQGLPRAVCVYCGSSGQVDDSFKQMAREVATALAKSKITIVYGGGRVGLMGIAADSALAAGGEVIGIIPSFITEYEVQHTKITKLYIVDSMHTRKKMMVEQSDAFVILPGGYGTLDEAFEVLSWKKLKLHNKPIVVYNKGGFWDPLLDLIKHMRKHGFITQQDLNSFSVVNNIDGLIEAISRKPEGETVIPTTSWF